jgi:hypothetical protein
VIYLSLQPPFVEAVTYEKKSYFISTMLVYVLEYIYIIFTDSNSLFLEPGVAQWLRNYATSRKVPGSIPGGVTEDFFRCIRQFHVPGIDSAS